MERKVKYENENARMFDCQTIPNANPNALYSGATFERGAGSGQRERCAVAISPMRGTPGATHEVMSAMDTISLFSVEKTRLGMADGNRSKDRMDIKSVRSHRDWIDCFYSSWLIFWKSFKLALLNFEWVIFSNIYPGGETYLTRNRMAACQESALFVMAVAAQKPRPQPFPSLFVPARRQGFASPNRKKRGSPLTPFRDFSDAKSMPGHPTYPLRFQKRQTFGC